ncbi:MAG: restriction endonuclease subunit S [Clostridia bacterium]|nr:restriction endonuclease subunit S [Clostridia bacterium]
MIKFNKLKHLVRNKTVKVQKLPFHIDLENIKSKSGELIIGELLDLESNLGEAHAFNKCDILYGKLRPYLEKFYFCDTAGSCSSEFLVLESIKVYPKYLYQVVRTPYFNQYCDAHSYGVKMPRTSWRFVREIEIPIHPLLDQEKIATKTDLANRLIQQTITSKIQQIELLQEYEKSIIHQAVTKGIDKNVKLKDSGIEWMGQIPSQWNVFLLKRLCAERITDGPHETPEFIDAGIPFLSVDSIQEGKIIFENCRHISMGAHDEYKKKANPKKGDVLLGKAASVGKVALVDVDFEFSIWSPLALIRTNNKRLLPEFLELYLKSDILQDQISILSSENTQKNIGMNKIERIHIIVPPIMEQQEIIKTVKLKISQIHKSIDVIKKTIDAIEEYRKSLIFELVTGKVRVA